MRQPIKKHHLAAFTVGTVAAVALAGCGRGAGTAMETGNSDGAEEMTISIGSAPPADSPVAKGTERFAEIVGEQSAGRITVEVYPAEQLGSEPEMLEGLSMGSVNVAVVATALIAEECPKLGAYALPYAIAGEDAHAQYENLRKATSSGWNEQAVQECADNSGKLVLDNSWWYGNRHVTTKSTPVQTPDDLKGLVIRTPPAELHTLAMKAFGAETEPMSFSEVYTALDTGVLDGQENPISTIHLAGLHEVQNQLSLTRHMTQSQAVVVDQQWFEGLSEEDQDLVREAIDNAAAYQSDLQLTANEDQLDLLREAGMNVIEPDLAPFQAATEGVTSRRLNDLGTSLEEFQQIQQG